MNTDPDIQTVPPRQSNEAFKVLLLGNCNSGKTSLINALVGRVDFLPTDYLPMTGVVTEVVYGNHHGMTIYPRKYSGLANYVALYKPNVNTISQHCCIDNTADAEAACDFFLKYERAVMEYDALLLQEGFMRIDTFGTNGPD